MGRKTPRVKGQKKGKKWGKGQSSSSNPNTTKFRDRAKKVTFADVEAAVDPKSIHPFSFNVRLFSEAC
jgi:hypothetical protein